MNDSPAEFALTRYARALWNEFAAKHAEACEHVQTGTLWLAATESELAHVRAQHAFYSANQIESEILDPQNLYAAEPALRPGLLGALRIPGDAVVFAPAAAQILARPVNVLQAEVTAISSDAVHLSSGERLRAPHIVVATGIDALQFFPHLKLRPRKGHLALVSGYHNFVQHDLIELGYLQSAHGEAKESIAFNVQPRTGGRLLLGSSRQYDVADPAVEPEIMRRMLARVAEYLPGLANPAIERSWTGFRAATPDKLPYIGPVVERSSLYLATGHEGLGITTALATAALLRDQILGVSPAIDASPYLPYRFL
jgi:glycine/D-amino acid oxidase-like deaminating enzyme